MPDDLLSCRDLNGSIIEYLEDAMTPEVKEPFEEHVGFCDDCLVHIDRMRIAAKIVAELPHTPVPGSTKEAILAIAGDRR